MYTAELNDERFYRESEVEAYINYLKSVIDYDETVSKSIDVNKNLNAFINKSYARPYDYYEAYSTQISNSFFATLCSLNQDKITIYAANNTILNGKEFQNLTRAEGNPWYERFIASGRDEAAFVYYDDRPLIREYDKDKFIYVRKMKNTKSPITKYIVIEHKFSRIREGLAALPTNCSVYVCCDDYVPFSNRGENVSIETVKERAAYEPYKTVKEFRIKGALFKVYAFTDDTAIMSVLTDKIWLVIALLLFTIIIPILLMKIMEKSITDRISILGKAFGEGSNDIFQSIEHIEGSDEIALLMYNYNRIVGINNALTTTIYKDKLREQENDIARKNAELLALQSQINPHFLFNALESIRMHSVLKGEDETAEMVQKLAVMERQNVEWHEDSVTIGEEEEFIEAYLQLQSYRFGERISFDIDIDDDCRNIKIPKLTLVTFVENACVHGIESKSSQGWIFVRVYKKDGALIIEVEDTGDGMDEDDVKILERRMNYVTIETVKKAKHVGILNACLRMKLMFDNKPKFTIESEKGIGMSVIITIPSESLKEDKGGEEDA